MIQELVSYLGIRNRSRNGPWKWTGCKSYVIYNDNENRRRSNKVNKRRAKKKAAKKQRKKQRR